MPIKLAERVGSQNIYLNSPVAHIDQSNSNLAIVTTKNGLTLHGKYVILAMPPTMSTRIQYNPPMPGLRDQFCQRMPIGHIIKTVTLFKSYWWREKSGYNGFFANDTCNDKYPCVAGFDVTEYPGLVGFITSHTAKNVGLLTKQDRQELVLNQYALQFGQTLEFVKSELVEYFEKDWAQSEYNRGAYESFTTPGTLTGCGKAWREPIDKIYFAGTEVAEHWNGYMVLLSISYL